MKKILFILFAAILLTGCKKSTEKAGESAGLTPEEARKIAKESYIAMYPLVYNYGTMYAQAINGNAPEYVGGFGVYRHYGLASPANKDIPTPNNNTPYSWAWVDLRAEPWVLTMPPSDGNRYYTSQWDDLWGYVLDAPGSIKDGQGGGNYLLCTVDYKGELPKGIKRAIVGESKFLGTLTRTGVNGDGDVPKMKAVQAGYKLQPLSKFLGNSAPSPAPKIEWPAYDAGALKTADFFKFANLMLQYTISNPADKPILDNAAKIGVAPGKIWDTTKMDPAIVKAIEEGIADANKEIESEIPKVKDASKFFNTREFVKEDYLNRTLGVVMGQFGNFAEQAFYTTWAKDDKGNDLDASKSNYSITFPANGTPKVKFFWSLTMYDLPGRFLVANQINRYSIGSQTTGLKKEKDGSIIIYIQTSSPGKDKESNWLPTPNAPFFIVMRMYGPDRNIIEGKYVSPQLVSQAK